MALQRLLGLIRTAEPMENDLTPQVFQTGGGPRMGGGPSQHHPAVNFGSLAGDPRRQFLSEPHQEETMKEPPFLHPNEIYGMEGRRELPHPGLLGGYPTEANFVNLFGGDLQTGALLPQSGEGTLSTAAGSDGSDGGRSPLGHSFTNFLTNKAWQVKDWIKSPKRQPLKSPGPQPKRGLLPVSKPLFEKRNKDKLKAALAAASALKARGLKKPSIESRFVAESAKDSKNAKKRTVALILETLSGNSGGIPLNVDLLKGLASALLEGGYLAGEGYLVEAKLWHIEEGNAWSDHLDRTFKQCKRALARGQGPRKKAVEVPANLRDNPNKLTFAQNNKAVKFGVEIFKFCVVWMLREIELANLTTKDIILDHTGKRVTLNIRVSKMDPEAKGVKRTMQCLCTGNDCTKECPFAVSMDLLVKTEKFGGTGSGLSMMRDKSTASKSQIVKTWQMLFGDKVTGHSGRRSGALHYIRNGWSVGQVAHLGRWKSNAILAYAEEALEEHPQCSRSPGD